MFEIVDWRTSGRQTDDGVTGILLAHPWAFGSDELKKWTMWEQPFLYATHWLDPIHMLNKYYENISKGIRVMEPPLKFIFRHIRWTSGKSVCFFVNITQINFHVYEWTNHNVRRSKFRLLLHLPCIFAQLLERTYTSPELTLYWYLFLYRFKRATTWFLRWKNSLFLDIFSSRAGAGLFVRYFILFLCGSVLDFFFIHDYV